MNIFFLHLNTKEAAKMHVNKHIVKMPLEHLQLLCSAHHVKGSKNKLYKPPYKITHKNHPCNLKQSSILCYQEVRRAQLSASEPV